MKNVLMLIFLLSTNLIFGQTPPEEYNVLILKADSLYQHKNYKESAITFSEAFKIFGWKGLIDHRYNAACSWALAGISDSAFFNLERIVNKGNFVDYDHLTTDPDLNSLHEDKRWNSLVKTVKKNKEKLETNLNKSLARELDSIYTEDQKYRLMMNEHREKYGRESEEMKELLKTLIYKDSLNLIRVKEILDHHGWLGADVVGSRGNTTLFLVIQHSDLKTQEKYLPMMKDAVKAGNANASHLALLIDRVEMGNKRPQIYGSQITLKDGKPEVYQIADEINVNKRRAEVGLDPLENYLKQWDIEYKLPAK